jgi:hypothetical protein
MRFRRLSITCPTAPGEVIDLMRRADLEMRDEKFWGMTRARRYRPREVVAFQERRLALRPAHAGALLLSHQNRDGLTTTGPEQKAIGIQGEATYATEQ